MRLAFIGGFGFRPKGTIRARAFPLAAELVRHGHEVTIFLPPYDNPAGLGTEWEQEGVRIKNVGRPARHRAKDGAPASPLTYPSLLASLITEVRRYHPDLIHAFKPKGFSGAAAGYFLWRHTFPVVVDCDDWEGWGGWNELQRYPWFVKEYIDRQERWLMRSAPALTVASRTLERRAIELRGGHGHVFYVPNCGATGASRDAQERVRSRHTQETRRQLGLPDGLIILYSGHFDSAEDVRFFCRASVEAAASRRAAVVLVGDGPELERAKDWFALYPQIKLFCFPHLPYEDFLRVVWAADIAAFPYPDDLVHRAKCSARIVDYMLMEKPVITSAVGQNCEYIEDGESGILTVPGNYAHFSEKLDQLLSDPELRSRLGRGARARILSRFNWSGEPLRQCLAAYAQVLPERAYELSPASV
ncbi:MAG TPA: glycosyltransferase family 4 protein [Terriglobales bacterium]|nr:glycosyltransferase family 4 protein [Terriglobales bacterium]